MTSGRAGRRATASGPGAGPGARVAAGAPAAGAPAADGVELSLVVPMYNEAAALDVFFRRAVPVLEQVSGRFEIVFVDDGSRDPTLDLLRAWHRRDARIKVVALSRNFGKELALTAGLDFARGAAVIPIDADLQDPPEVIADLVARWREGYDVVLARRADRQSDTPAKRATARLFYRLINLLSEIEIPADVGDFRLMDRRVVEALGRMPERMRFMKGLFAWPGYRQTVIEYRRAPRSAGGTKWSYWKLWNLALGGIVSFSTVPLRIWSYIGASTAAFAILYMTYVVLRTLVAGVDVPGYASLLALLLFFNGLNMIGLGILGEYLGRVFVEVKQRPLYLVADAIGFEAPAPARRRARREAPARTVEPAL